jgi:hypothetical protein
VAISIRIQQVFIWTVAAATLTSCATATHRARTPERSTIDPPQRAERERTYLRLPLRFEPASDQETDRPAFVAHGRGFALRLSATGAAFALQSKDDKPAILNMRLDGSKPAAVTPLRPLQGISNYIQGTDRQRWRLGVPGYAEVECAGIYPGIDIVFYGNQQTLEYDFRVAPGADLAAISIRFDAPTHIDADGNLIVRSGAGDLTQHAPLIYQTAGNDRRMVDGGYAVRADGTVGFRVGAHDERLPLVIDPVLTYSTFLGGNRQERGNDVAVDSTGAIIVTGETFSDDFPTAAAGQPVRRGFGDVFVAKLTADGSALVYATYLGGGGYDQGRGVAADAAGAAYVVGQTFSVDFPATSSLAKGRADAGDAFVAKLDAAGTLVFATLLGGTSEDNGTAIAVDALGRAHVTGSTISGDFPTANAGQPSLTGYPAFHSTDGGQTWAGLLNGLTADGTRSFGFDTSTRPTTVYAGTELQGIFKSVDGGTSWTRPANINLPPIEIHSIAVGSGSPATLFAGTSQGVFRSDDQGESWVDLYLGVPVSSVVVLPNSPSTVYAATSWGAGEGVFRSTDGGATWTSTGLAGSVTILATSGATVYAAMSGGGLQRLVDGGSWTAVSDGLPSEVIALAVSPVNADMEYAGTFDGLFATTDGGVTWTPVFSGIPIAAVAFARSEPATTYVLTYWSGLAVTRDGGATWQPAGEVSASPYAFAVDPALATSVFVTNSLAWDAFVATLSTDGSSLEYATYLGGTNVEVATGIALDAAGARYVVGETYSDDLPVRHAVQASRGGLYDIFVAKLSPAGAIDYATYLGGWGAEYAGRIAVDGIGRAYVAGLTWSMNFPVSHAAQPMPGGGYSDAFVTALSEAGDSFVYSTYLGGSGMENDSTQSMGPDIAVTAAGEAFVTGTTMSTDFVVSADAFQRARSGGATDGFVTAFNAGGQLQYSSFLGGTGADYPRGIAVAGDERAAIVGWTDSADLPIVGGVQTTYGGSEDAFIVTVRPGTPNQDVTPPHSSISVSGTQGSAGWYRSAVSLTITAQDDAQGQGVRTIEYSLNGGPFHVYDGPFEIATQGATTVAARATDFANNLEPGGPVLTVRIDSVGPGVTVSSPKPRAYLHTDVLPVVVLVDDATSGVAGAAAATLDGTAVTTTTIKLLALALGDHLFSASVTDVAGNTSNVAVSFRVTASIDSLMEAVRIYAAAGAFDSSIQRSLMAKLTAANDAYARGNLQTVRAKLRDFISQCTALSGGGMSAAAADALIADAKWVIDRL